MTAKKKFTFLYIHGFRSSPESTKAKFLREFAVSRDIDFVCPPLSINPQIAAQQVKKVSEHIARDNVNQVVIGSSLGGFYATWLMQTCTLNHNDITVLLNPVVMPSIKLKENCEDLETSQVKSLDYEPFKPEYVRILQKMEAQIGSKIKHPKNVLLVAAKGDEVLDWREMVSFYSECKHLILDDSNHSITDFNLHWPKIFNFLAFS
tara:strand:- start:213 stop:830 length:618 start_codon:yes stop_codon:yes gene_type:complete